MNGILKDFQYAARTLLRSPGFTLATVLTLAIGIGGTTAMFSALDQATLRPLPVKDPERLVYLQWNGPWMNGSNTGFAKWSYPWYEDLRDESEIFEELFCKYMSSANFGHAGESRRIRVSLVSGNYFGGLGINASGGRAITPDDDKIPGGHPLAVLGHSFWAEQFNSDPAVIGQSIQLNGRAFEVIGVGPKGFRGVEFGDVAQVFVPVAMKAALSPGWMAMYDLEKRRNRWVQVVGRLKPGISIAAADVALEPLFRSLVEYDLEQPELTAAGEYGRERYRSAQLDVHPGAQGVWPGRDASKTALTTLMSMVGLLLLIGCANVANLLMARGAVRGKELAIRVAIGAGRLRVIRQLMAESLLLAIAGGALGLAVSAWTMSFIVWVVGDSNFQNVISTAPDPRVMTFTLAISLLTAVIFGLMPAIHSVRLGIASSLREQAGSLAGGLALRKAFVAFQVFLSVLLLVGAGMFMRTLDNLRAIDTGIKTEETLVFGLEPIKNGYNRESADALLETLRRRLASLPGVENASYAMVRVLAGNAWNSSVEVEGYKKGEGENMNVYHNAVASGYFDTLGAAILEGRDFRESDGATAPQVGIVNQKFAEAFFKGESPIGRKFTLGGGDPVVEIVGVVPDLPYEGVREEVPRQAYVPFAQMNGALEAHLHIRGSIPPEELVIPARQIVRELDANIPVFDLNVLEDDLNRTLTLKRLIANLGGAFGVVAALLSGVGLYGILAFSMARRRREIGLRIALGAQRTDIAGLALKELVVLFGVGVVAAIPVSVALGRVIEAQLYGVSAFDPLTIAGAVAGLVVVSAAASFLPAWNAARTEPMTALRFE